MPTITDDERFYSDVPSIRKRQALNIPLIIITDDDNYNPGEGWLDVSSNVPLLQAFIKVCYPRVAKLEPLTISQEKALFSNYSSSRILGVLDALENDPRLYEKCNSIYLSIKTWANARQNKRFNENEFDY